MKIFKFILLALIIITANLSFAQKDNNSRRQMRTGIDSLMKQKISEKLNLDEFTSEKFMNTYKENNKKIRILNKEKNNLLESIELNPDASDIDTKLNGVLELESKIFEQRKSFINELRSFLTPQQIAKTLILRKNFGKEFKKEILKQRKGNKNNEFDGKNFK